MATITVEIPDDVALRLSRAGVPGLSVSPDPEWSRDLYAGVDEVLEFLASLPTPEETIALRASPSLQARVSELLAKNRDEGLSAEEEAEFDRYEYADHLVRMAKAAAFARLQG